MTIEGLGIRRRRPTQPLPQGSRGLLLGGLGLRWIVWRRLHELDRQLAEGVDPMQSDELSLRLGQLGSGRIRARLACGLRGAVEFADRPRELLSPPLVRRSEVRASREVLLELAGRIGTDGPLGVKGLALASLLLGDGASPLYYDIARRSLTDATLEALVGLERGHRTFRRADGSANKVLGWRSAAQWVSRPMAPGPPGAHAPWAITKEPRTAQRSAQDGRSRRSEDTCDLHDGPQTERPRIAREHPLSQRTRGGGLQRALIRRPSS